MTAAAGVPAGRTALRDLVAADLAAGRRFAGLMGTQRGDAILLSAHLAGPGSISTRDALLPTPGRTATRR